MSRPDLVGVESGVTTVIDAGTSGATTFEVSRTAHVDHPATRTNISCLMDPCQIHKFRRGLGQVDLRFTTARSNSAFTAKTPLGNIVPMD